MNMGSLLSQPIINHYSVVLEPMTAKHQVLLRAWRNAPEIQENMLSQQDISEEQQQAWYKKVQQDPCQWHWLVRYKEQYIGATNVRTICRGETVVSAHCLEPGLYIGEQRYQGNILAFSPTLAMYDYCFATLKVGKFRAVVKSSNSAALNYNQKLGYEVVESGDLFVLELTEANYKKSTQKLKQFLSRNNIKRG